MGLERLSPNHAAARPAERRAARGVVVRSFSPRVESTGTTHAQSFVLFSSRRRHTRCSRDWRFRRVLFRSGTDLAMGVPARFGLGFGLAGGLVPLPNANTIFWGGYGGSIAIIDMDARMSISYVMNVMRGTTTGDVRGFGIAMAAWQSLAARARG